MRFCSSALSESNVFTKTGELNENRQYHTATLLPNGKVLVVGGTISGGKDFGKCTATCELYDPNTEKWTLTGSLKTARKDHTATLLPDGKVLVAGGGSPDLRHSIPIGSAEIYDPATGLWNGTGRLQTVRMHHKAALLSNGKVLVVGGAGHQGASKTLCNLLTCELYDPAFGKWIRTASHSLHCSIETATLLQDGNVLLTYTQSYSGGMSPPSESGLYDPIAGKEKNTGRLVESVAFQTATLLSNGNVFVAGGVSLKSKPELVENAIAAEIYDVSSGKWRKFDYTTTGRYGHTLTLLPDDHVLVVGGHYKGEQHSEQSRAGREALVYNPNTGIPINCGNSLANRRYHTATMLSNGKVLLVQRNT